MKGLEEPEVLEALEKYKTEISNAAALMHTDSPKNVKTWLHQGMLIANLKKKTQLSVETISTQLNIKFTLSYALVRLYKSSAFIEKYSSNLPITKQSLLDALRIPKDKLIELIESGVIHRNITQKALYELRADLNVIRGLKSNKLKALLKSLRDGEETDTQQEYYPELKIIADTAPVFLDEILDGSMHIKNIRGAAFVLNRLPQKTSGDLPQKTSGDLPQKTSGDKTEDVSDIDAQVETRVTEILADERAKMRAEIEAEFEFDPQFIPMVAEWRLNKRTLTKPEIRSVIQRLHPDRYPESESHKYIKALRLFKKAAGIKD